MVGSLTPLKRTDLQKIAKELGIKANLKVIKTYFKNIRYHIIIKYYKNNINYNNYKYILVIHNFNNVDILFMYRNNL